MQENWPHHQKTHQGSPPLHDGAVQRSHDYGFNKIQVPVVPEVGSGKDARAWLSNFYRDRDYARYRQGRQDQVGAAYAATYISGVSHQQQLEILQRVNDHKNDVDWEKILKTVGILGFVAFLQWLWENRKD